MYKKKWSNNTAHFSLPSYIEHCIEAFGLMSRLWISLGPIYIDGGCYNLLHMDPSQLLLFETCFSWCRNSHSTIDNRDVGPYNDDGLCWNILILHLIYHLIIDISQFVNKWTLLITQHRWAPQSKLKGDNNPLCYTYLLAEWLSSWPPQYLSTTRTMLAINL